MIILGFEGKTFDKNSILSNDIQNNYFIYSDEDGLIICENKL